jgi:hypothetical protein
MQDTTKEDFLIKNEEFLEKQREKARAAVSTQKSLPENIKQIIPNLNLVNNAQPNIDKQVERTPVVESSLVHGSDPFSNVLKALIDTSLPSKQPLHKADPFNFMTSRDFIVSFVFISLLLVNLMNIMS